MRKITIALALMTLPFAGNAQYAFDVLHYNQSQLSGTSRYMSMAGAFGALGGDISAVNNNPGGIGIYRSSDANITFSLDMNSSQATGEKQSNTRFTVNSIGYVGAIRMNSDVMPNLNFGFTYNRNNSFRRHYTGYMSGIPTSVTNYIAEKTMQDKMTVADLTKKNAYFDGYALWDQIAAYQTYLINPTDSEGKKFSGLGYDGVFGEAEFEVEEWGHTDEYNVTFGGNIKNQLYWGVGFGFTELEYDSYKYYGEVLNNTVIHDQVEKPESSVLVDGKAALGIVNSSHTDGFGINAKFGVIYKPVNELRLGVAIHTPTRMSLKDTYGGNISAEYSGEKVKKNYTIVEKYPDNTVRYDLVTPWKFMGSAAAVVGGKAILSADYEYEASQYMRICDDRGHELADATDEIKAYLQPVHTMRVGAEYRVSPKFSLRAGYSYQTSAAQDAVKDDKIDVEVSGCNPAYSYDKSNQHITAGFGYHSGSFYFDMAYVNQLRKTNYHAFSGIADLPTVCTEVKDNNNRVTATVGFRF
ncbi:MAG: outer membrane protein transport protein [Bacteroidales bacterium]|nr:outer membrane protein transport protein [Candidatus Sodaliphilus fimicaballi]